MRKGKLQDKQSVKKSNVKATAAPTTKIEVEQKQQSKPR
jgi:hypothetical protein